MRKIEGYQCDNCGEIHSSEEKALACEKSHQDRLKSAKIDFMKFRDKTGTYGIDRGYAEIVPVKIRVKFSEQHGDFATFVLEHYGFKGV